MLKLPARGSAAFSVLIGPNGSGKSRALAAALDEMILLERLRGEWYEGRIRRVTSSNDEDVATIVYRLEGKIYEVKRVGKSVRCWVDSETCTLNELKLPKKALAFAHLPVDRFIFSRNERDGFYSYFGLRQATNLTTTGALELKIILSLFKGYSRRDYPRKIEEWLKLLGLSTPLRIRIVANSEFFEAGNIEDFAAITAEAINRRRGRGRADFRWSPESLDTCWVLFCQLKKHVTIERRASFAWLTIDENFFRNGPPPEFWIFGLEEARRHRLISQMNLLVRRHQVEEEFINLSSGEQQIFGTVSRLLSEIEQNSLIVIDEPEVSLHPQWQRLYLPTLRRSLADFPSTHVLIATHSHFLVSDLEPEHATLLVPSLTGPGDFEEFDGDVYGRSPENLLYRVFGIGVVGNFQVERDMGVALQMLSDRIEFNLPELQKIFSRLKRIDSGDNPAFSKILDEIKTGIEQASHD